MTTQLNVDPPPAQPVRPPGAEQPSDAGRALVVGLIVVLLVATLGAGAYQTWRSTRSLPEEPRGGCDPIAAAGKPGAQPEGKTVHSLELRENQITQAEFGRSASAKVVTVYLDLTGDISNPSTPLFARVDTFRRTDDGRLTSANVVPSAVVNGRLVILSVCFGRVNDHLGDPGTYNGSITIDDERLSSAVTVPFTVTMQFRHGIVLLWLLLLTIVPGTWVLWVVRTRRDPTQPALHVTDLARWLWTVEGVVVVVTGGVAASGVYIATYLRDPTWGYSVLQPLTLYGAMFSAFITTAAITQITKLAALPNPDAGQVR